MYDIKELRNNFNMENLLHVIRLFYGYLVVIIIAIVVIRLIKYIQKHEPTGTKITELYDEKGQKRPPLNIKPVIRSIVLIVVLLIIYIILMFIKV